MNQENKNLLIQLGGHFVTGLLAIVICFNLLKPPPTRIATCETGLVEYAIQKKLTSMIKERSGEDSVFKNLLDHYIEETNAINDFQKKNEKVILKITAKKKNNKKLNKNEKAVLQEFEQMYKRLEECSVAVSKHLEKMQQEYIDKLKELIETQKKEKSGQYDLFIELKEDTVKVDQLGNVQVSDLTSYMIKELGLEDVKISKKEKEGYSKIKLITLIEELLKRKGY